jgi:threonine/homoserine/homoserine lactone efflux protein
MLSNLLNPQPVLFYMMFLPQFVDPAYAALPQSLMVAGIHFTEGIFWLGGLSLVVHQARVALLRPSVARLINGLVGQLVEGFGVKLALFDK